MDKVVRDGKVAVLYSPGYGAGWSTWNDCPVSMVFDPKTVEWVENGKVGECPYKHIRYRYPDGDYQLEIAWLPIGTVFEIEEYDGSENVRIIDNASFLVA